MVALVWLNGPGFRWLAPMVARQVLEKADWHGGFAVEGSLFAGFSLTNIELSDARTGSRIRARRITPLYRFREALDGRMRGLRVEALAATLELATRPPQTPPADEQPIAAGLAAILRAVDAAHARVGTFEFDLREVSLDLRQNHRTVLRMAPSSLHRKAGESAFLLELGTLTDATGSDWPAQSARIDWSRGALAIDRIDPMPELALRDVQVAWDPDGTLTAADVDLRVGDAVLHATAIEGPAAVQLELLEGRLDVGGLARRFGFEPPLRGGLTSLRLDLEGLLPDPRLATGALHLQLDDSAWGEWSSPELAVGLTLDAGSATLDASGRVMGSPVSLRAEAPIERGSSGEPWRPGDLSATIEMADAPALAAELARVFSIKTAPTRWPASSARATAAVTFTNGWQPAAANVDITLAPTDQAAASSMNAALRWQAKQATTCHLVGDGWNITGSVDREARSYEATARFGRFRSARVLPWLAAFHAGPKVDLDLNGHWQGKGSWKDGNHQGSITGMQVTLHRSDTAPVLIRGNADYAWPQECLLRGLVVETGGQRITGDVRLAEGTLGSEQISWSDGARQLARASFRIPVPRDLPSWRESLTDDDRPLRIEARSEVLTVGLLKAWIPALARLDDTGSALLALSCDGSWKSPAASARLECRQLKPTGASGMAPARLDLSLTGNPADGVQLQGEASMAGFPPLALAASMPFRPAAWLADAGAAVTEPLTARVRLDRCDLARLQPWLPAISQVKGRLDAAIDLAGTLAKPDARGQVDLRDGGFEVPSADLPAVTRLNGTLRLTPERITLDRLAATIAGGGFSADGSLALQDGAPGQLELRLRGNHLPVKRNDSLILRANADLRVAGPWQRAAVTGTLGAVDSLFHRDIELLPIGTPFVTRPAASLPKLDRTRMPRITLPDPFRDWTVDLRARTENPFLIRGNVATGSIAADLRVRGPLGSPRPDGTIRLTGFEASLPFTTLKVPTAILRFDADHGWDPGVEIRGAAEPRPYRVALYAYGRASDPQLVLTSSPPLPESEIMTLLATGTTTTGLENPQAASSRAMQLFAEEIRRGRFAAGKRLRPLLGLADRLDFAIAEEDPYSSESFSTATLAVTDRWFLSAGMGEEGDSRVFAIWRISFE
jgi:TamB, inner membrane protein subunit of TAM complex